MKNNTLTDDTLKILIIGANGFLGTNLLRFKEEYETSENQFHFVTADISNSNINPKMPFYHIDITNADDAVKKIINISPDITLLTAAMTDVDECEVNKELAKKINTEGPQNVIKACQTADSKLIFMSTDFVFDGTKKEGLYNETDTPNPLSFYAKTKYDAELAIINSNLDYLICRTAVLYGWNKSKLNFITWILKKLELDEPISIVTTQINSPTFVKNLAEIILKLIEKEATGIYHTAGDGAINRYEMAIHCADVFNLNKSLISPLASLKQQAVRPKNAGLDISKLKTLLGSELKVYSLDDGLQYMKTHSI